MVSVVAALYCSLVAGRCIPLYVQFRGAPTEAACAAELAKVEPDFLLTAPGYMLESMRCDALTQAGPTP